MRKSKITAKVTVKEKTLSMLKKGEYFSFVGYKKVYVYDGGGPVRGFNYHDADDINATHSTKTNRKVDNDLTY